MIRFIAACFWLCAVTVAAVIYSFQPPGQQGKAQTKPPLLGGLDYVSTEILSVPVTGKGGLEGYLLARLVYTVDPEEFRRLSVPADALFSDELYSFVFSNRDLDFSRIRELDVDAIRAGLRDRINARLGEELVHEVMISQVDFLSKNEIRENAMRRRPGRDATPAAEAPVAGH
jgi:hypothetical protein